MRASLALTLFVVVAAFPLAAFSAERPNDAEFNFEFTYTTPGGGLTEIPDSTVKWYPLPLTLDPPEPDWVIDYLEFEIAGLSHTETPDLNVFLLDPFGGGIEIMDDAGNSDPVADITLLFTDFWDLGFPLPHGGAGPLLSFPDTVMIYNPDGPGEFIQYTGDEVPTDPWYVIVIDDDLNSYAGNFESVTLRGIAVPEPVTLTLLALGALVALRRRRW